MSSRTDRPIRAVHLINHLGYGGSERQLALLLRHFDRGGFEHRVVVFNPSPERVYDDVLADLGVAVVAMPRKYRGVARRLLFLARRLRAWRADVVHSWTLHDNPYAAVAGRLAGVAVRWGSLRGSLASEGARSLGPWIRRLALAGPDRLVVNSRALLAELAAAGFPPERALLLLNGVELPEPAAPADLSPLGIGTDSPVVSILGNLRRIKNHGLFVRAMAVALPPRPEARALIVGQPLASEPSYPAEIETEIERHGLTGRIVLTGFRPDVPSLLARSAVICLTSHSEGMPNAVLEAMAAGRPVAACRVGGVPELIDDGAHGLLVDPGDEVALGAAVGRLLDDPELAKSLGRAGRERALAEFTCDAAARRLGDAYRAALGEGRR